MADFKKCMVRDCLFPATHGFRYPGDITLDFCILHTKGLESRWAYDGLELAERIEAMAGLMKTDDFSNLIRIIASRMRGEVDNG